MTIKSRIFRDGSSRVEAGDFFSYEDLWIKRELYYKLKNNILAFNLSKIELQNSPNSRWLIEANINLKFDKHKYIRVAFKKLYQLYRQNKNTSHLAVIIRKNLKVLGFDDREIYAIVNPNSITEDIRLEKHFGIWHLVGKLQREYEKIK